MMNTEKSIWKTTVEITPRVVRLLVTEAAGDVLKAEFRAYPDHTRALMFMLEGLALYSGHPLSVAIIAESPVSHSLGLGSFGGEDWPETNALIDFVFVETDQGDRHRISGVGDFKQLRMFDRYGRVMP
jgi:hypothetical protein